MVSPVDPFFAKTFATFFLPYFDSFFAGSSRFPKYLRYSKTISEASSTDNAEDLDITYQMEAFCYFVYDNNIEKWKKTIEILSNLNTGAREYDQIKILDSKQRAKELNEYERNMGVYWVSTEEYPDLKTPHTKPHSGQNMLGGWETKAICDFGILAQEIKKVRLEPKGKAWEKDLLEKLCKFKGIGDKIAAPKAKKAKKVAPPPTDDTPTKEAFNLAFE